MSYAPNATDEFRRVGEYVDTTLRRARHGDLPIEQSSKFELVINLRIDKALGLTVPPSLLVRAERGRSVTARRILWWIALAKVADGTGHDDMIADHAVMRDMCPDHEQAVVTTPQIGNTM